MTVALKLWLGFTIGVDRSISDWPDDRFGFGLKRIGQELKITMSYLLEKFKNLLVTAVLTRVSTKVHTCARSTIAA